MSLLRLLANRLASHSPIGVFAETRSHSVVILSSWSSDYSGKKSTHKRFNRFGELTYFRQRWASGFVSLNFRKARIRKMWRKTPYLRICPVCERKFNLLDQDGICYDCNH